MTRPVLPECVAAIFLLIFLSLGLLNLKIHVREKEGGSSLFMGALQVLFDLAAIRPAHPFNLVGQRVCAR